MKKILTIIGRYLYLAFSWLFVAGVVYQVYLTGMAVVAQRQSWRPHADTGHALVIPLVLMLLSMYLGRMPRQVKVITWLLFLAYFLQAYVLISMRRSVPALSALHPVLALVDFGLGLWLAVQAFKIIRSDRQTKEPVVMSTDEVIMQGE